MVIRNVKFVVKYKKSWGGCSLWFTFLGENVERFGPFLTIGRGGELLLIILAFVLFRGCIVS